MMVRVNGRTDGTLELQTENATAELSEPQSIARIPHLRGAIIHSSANYLLIKPQQRHAPLKNTGRRIY